MSRISCAFEANDQSQPKTIAEPANRLLKRRSGNLGRTADTFRWLRVERTNAATFTITHTHFNGGHLELCQKERRITDFFVKRSTAIL